MASGPVVNAEAMEAMTPDERLAATAEAVVTDPAAMTPAVARMVNDGWADQDSARQSSPKG